MQDFVYKTLWLVRISLLISAITKNFTFFSGKLFYKSNRKPFSCVCIAWCKHSRGWENSRQLGKPSTSSRVCITVSNSLKPSYVYIRLCKHGKRFLLLKWLWLFSIKFNCVNYGLRSGAPRWNTFISLPCAMCFYWTLCTELLRIYSRYKLINHPRLST